MYRLNIDNHTKPDMNSNKKVNMARLRISLCIVIISMLTLISVVSLNAQTPKTGVQSVLVFPLDNDSGAENSQIAAKIVTKVVDGLGADGNYNTIMYLSRLPFVQRFIATNPQKNISASGPFSSDAKTLADAFSLSEAAGVNLAVVGSLSRYELNEKNIFEATVTIQILDVKKKETRQTFVVSGSSETQDGVIVSAANKIIEQITGKAVVASSSSNTTSAAQSSITAGMTTIIMPFAYVISDDGAANDINKQIAKQLQISLEKEFNNGKLFSVVKFNADTPSIRRAIKEGKLKAKDVTAPTDTTPVGAMKSQKIANLIGTYTSILGSIDSSSVNNDAVNLTATIQVISSKTGKVNTSIVINGSAVKTGNDEQKDITNKAVSDAVAKIIGQMRSSAGK